MGLRRADAPLYEDGEGRWASMSMSTIPRRRCRAGRDRETEVEQVDGRFIWFRVVAHDGIDQIGAGRHRRAVIRNEIQRPAGDEARQAGLEG